MAITAEALEELVRKLQPPAGGPKHFTHCPARFRGEYSAEAVADFLASADFFKISEGISDQNAVRGLSLLLEGPAHTWWMGIKSDDTTWGEAMRLIREEFAPRPRAYQVYLDVFSSAQEAHVPTGSFVAQKRALLAQLPTPPCEEVQLDMVYGLLKPQIRDRIPREKISTFSELLSKARDVEPHTTNKENKPPNALPNNGTGKAKPRVRCQFCRNLGHDITICRKRNAAEKQDQGAQPTALAQHTGGHTERPQIQCYGCQRPGVIRRNCPQCNASRPPGTSFSFVSFHEMRRPAVNITIGDQNGTAFLDTGAKNCLASPSLALLFRKMKLPTCTKDVEVTLADGGTTVRTAQVVTAPVTLQGRTLPTTFMILPDTPHAQTLLGIDFIVAAGLVLDFGLRLWHFHKEAQRHPFTPKDSSPGHTIGAVSAEPKHRLTPIRDYWEVPDLISPIADAPEVPMDIEMAQNYGPDPLARPASPRDYPHFKALGAHPLSRSAYMLADAEQAITDYWAHPDSDVFGTAYATLDIRLREDEGAALNTEQKDELNHLLEQHLVLFSGPGKPTDQITHRIDTGNAAPVSTPPYQLTPKRKEVLRGEVATLLETGIIEECESAWSSPAVLVPKPNGGVRLCIDYRRLNAVTRPDRYPLPRLDDLLHSTGKIDCISTMDLQSGYYQIAVHPEDRDKTCFITPFGTYRFTRMPFGLVNAPATFQRLMDRLRSQLPQLRLLAYLDDLVLLSPDPATHLRDLAQVLQKIAQYSLQLNRSKCRFGGTEAKYLGHRISREGIRADPEKVAAITNMPPPRSPKQVITFLQTCNWYRRYIPGFSEVARPLSQLTRQGAAWEWTQRQEDAFSALKTALTTAPILRQADPGLPYTLRTDASAYALGAALLQGEGPDERPVEYASRLLTSAERNYSTTEREALAIVWSIAKFRGYIEESSVVVITDHQPLKWLMSLRTPSGRLARWALQLQPYNLRIDYTSGKANVVADTLSRPPCGHNEESCSLCFISVDLPKGSQNKWRQDQLQDPELKKIIDHLEKGSPEEAIPWSSRGYLTSQGILYRYSPDDETEEAQLVVPAAVQPEILKQFHDAPHAGHHGVERTLHKIRQRFYWTGMRRTIADYLRQCPECQRYKPSNMVPAGLLQTPVMRQRLEVIAVDLFGPLPEGPSGQKWVFVIEDTTTRWTELFALTHATAEECAWTLVNEYCLRYGVPRRIISDNGPQFISSIMQHLTYCLGMSQHFTPVYHPAANPVERRNRDLKTQLAILVGPHHSAWPSQLPAIRFAMNTARCQSTGQTPAYLMFGQELRHPLEVTYDFRSIIQSETFIPEVTPRLLALADTLKEARETWEKEQDRHKQYTDRHRRPSTEFQTGDYVWVTSHALSSKLKQFSQKLAPRRDGPYIITHRHGPCSYQVASPTQPGASLGIYHVSALTPYHSEGTGPPADPPAPIQPIRRRGRPRKTQAPASLAETASRTLRGRM